MSNKDIQFKVTTPKKGYLLLKHSNMKLEIEELEREDVVTLYNFLINVKNPNEKLNKLIEDQKKENKIHEVQNKILGNTNKFWEAPVMNKAAALELAKKKAENIEDHQLLTLSVRSIQKMLIELVREIYGDEVE